MKKVTLDRIVLSPSCCAAAAILFAAILIPLSKTGKYYKDTF